MKDLKGIKVITCDMEGVIETMNEGAEKNIWLPKRRTYWT